MQDENLVRFQRYVATQTFSALNGLRGLSILAVIWHHTLYAKPTWLPLLGNGFLGVDLFFVISGFLIVTLLLRERSRTGRISLRRFYGRRALRIFPPYYALLACFSLVLLTLAPDANMASAFFSELPFHLTYTSNWIQTSTLFGITWSLAAEEQFYLLWPPVERFLARLALPVLGLLLLLNQLVNFRLLDDFLEPNLGIRYEDLHILQSTFTPILLGVLSAHVLHAPRSYVRIWTFLGSRAAAPIGLVVLLLVANRSGDLGGLPRLMVQLAMALLVTSCVIREDHGLEAFLQWPPLARIGTVSYGIYLYHLTALHAVDIALRGMDFEVPTVRFGLCTVASLAVAELSYRNLELPFLRLKHTLAST